MVEKAARILCIFLVVSIPLALGSRSNRAVDPVTTEQIQDIVGEMFRGNIEHIIQATYRDSAGKIDLRIDLSPNLGALRVDNDTLVVSNSGYEQKVGIGTAEPDATLDVDGDISIQDANGRGGRWHIIDYNEAYDTNLVDNLNADLWDGHDFEDVNIGDFNASSEWVEDIVGGMVSGNTETLIAVTYQDDTNDVDYVVDEDLHNYSWTNVDGTDLKTGSVTQAQGDVLDYLNTLDVPSGDGQFIVSVSDEAFAYESGNIARTSLGLGTGNSPAFVGLTITGALNFVETEIIGDDGEVNKDVVEDSTNWDTAYTHSQDNSQAHSDYLLNTSDQMDGDLTIDNTSTEALLVRQNVDAKDVFTVDTTNSKTLVNGGIGVLTGGGSAVIVGESAQKSGVLVGGDLANPITGTGLFYALDSSTYWQPTADNSSIYGYFSAVVSLGTYDVTNVTGMYGNSVVIGGEYYSGTVTNSIGGRFNAGTHNILPGDVTNVYGIYIGRATGGTAQNYGIYTAETAATTKNLLANDSQKTLFGTGEDASVYYDGTDMIINPKEVGTGVLSVGGNIQPVDDDTYYLGRNDDDSPKAYKGVILKDTTNGKYYRIEVINGVVTATDLTD